MSILKSIELWGRKRAARAIPAYLSEGGGASLNAPSRILVIRTDNRLGNLVLMEPLLRSLRVKFPDAGLHVLVSDVFSELLECQGYDVITVDKKEQIRNPADFVSLVRKLRSGSYDVAIDAAHPHSFSLSGAVSTLLSGAGCRISTDAGESSGWYTHTAAEPPLHWHESRSLHSLGNVWDNWPEWSPPELHAINGEKRNVVGLHVGASGSKKYPLEKLEALVDRVCRSLIIEVCWGSSEEREIAMYLSSRYPVALMPELTIAELIERIAGMRLFVTADNGPMHIASALSVPVIAIFRIDNGDRFAPLSEGSQVICSESGPDPDRVAAAVLRTTGFY